MAAFEYTRAENHFGSSFGKTFNKVIAAIMSWNDARVTRNALMSLSDRELDDIGLSRADIDTIAETTMMR